MWRKEAASLLSLRTHLSDLRFSSLRLLASLKCFPDSVWTQHFIIKGSLHLHDLKEVNNSTCKARKSGSIKLNSALILLASGEVIVLPAATIGRKPSLSLNVTMVVAGVVGVGATCMVVTMRFGLSFILKSGRELGRGGGAEAVMGDIPLAIELLWTLLARLLVEWDSIAVDKRDSCTRSEREFWTATAAGLAIWPTGTMWFDWRKSRASLFARRAQTKA